MTKEPFWPWDAGYDDIPDDDYLMAFAAGQQQNKSPFNYESCPSCPHELHGLPCTKHVPGRYGSSPCMCPTSLEAAL